MSSVSEARKSITSQKKRAERTSMGVMMESWQTVATTPAAPEATGVCSWLSAPSIFLAASKTEK